MMRSVLTLTTAAALLASFASWSAPAPAWAAGANVAVAIAALHPTQPSLGYKEVAYKVNRYKLDAHKRFDVFCEDAGQQGVATYNSDSSLHDLSSFRCKAPVGSHPHDMKTAVIAPNGQLYLTDGHHTYASFAELAGSDTKVFVHITDDFRQLPSMSAFWQQMQKRHLVWLQNGAGNTLSPQALPQHLGLKYLTDDPYRSLVYFTKKVAYQKPHNAPPFLEFYWGQWLAKQLPLKQGMVDSKYAYKDTVEKAAKLMVNVGKNTVIAHTAIGPTTAKQMGALTRINKKALGKLVSARGKLSYAFY
ncbi:ParB/Srx family N-terminal domain-containing protein [Gallaecimonas mangrovi]|uniref:ParB/Srx family N-terminal domain-containing protein n=1 Tax=Gallaecimonas mangrovi TaxID=2291597 RepID=UPI000E20C323|nr:ParB/Srx family N-terminal domain-containing protein [Gallaecimonas mangrovi]